MPRRGAPSAYRTMWLFTMFDLPTKTPAERRHYAQFRKELIAEGFSMLQYSVYARYCASEEAAARYRRRVRAALPPGGEVRVLAVTDIQFGKMEVFVGKRRADPEGKPEQLVLL